MAEDYYCRTGKPQKELLQKGLLQKGLLQKEPRKT